MDLIRNERMYTPKEIAAMLERSPEVVYGWIRDGHLPAVRSGPGKRAHKFVRESDLRPFLTELGFALNPPPPAHEAP